MEADPNRKLMKNRLLMSTAKLWAEASYSKRLKVGAVLSKNGRIIAIGYNGRLPGELNECEDEEGNTRYDVVHAEENVILYCAKHGIATEGAILHCTDSPCLHCARKIITAGIKEIYFMREYRVTGPIGLMARHGIICEALEAWE